jgi:hypothetical protein
MPETIMDKSHEALFHDILMLNRELLENISGLNLFISVFTAELRPEDQVLIKRIEDSLNTWKVPRPLDEAQVKARKVALNICKKLVEPHAQLQAPALTHLSMTKSYQRNSQPC